ncbi:hypothetical protein Areg01_58050 [Actinoplanes regularis]|nr:hypothetical protein Areg01_58050 [Actinoplanes regularis]
MTCLSLLVLIGICVALAAWVNRGNQRSVQGPTRPRGGPAVGYQPHRPATKQRSKPARKSGPPAGPAPNRAVGLSKAQTQAVLKRALGAAREAEQQRLRALVLEQERRIAARLRQGQGALDFAELRALHEKSWQTADLAKASLDGARSTEQAISETIRATHRAIETEQARGGRGVPAMRQALDALHVDRDVVRTYRDRYKQDLDRLNQETGRLRDSIGANCGEQGRRWHQTRMERKARREGRL